MSPPTCDHPRFTFSGSSDGALYSYARTIPANTPSVVFPPATNTRLVLFVEIRTSEPYHEKYSSPVRSCASCVHSLSVSSYTRTTPASSSPSLGAATTKSFPSFDKPTFFPNAPAPNRSSPTCTQFVLLYSNTRVRPPYCTPPVPSALDAPIAIRDPSKDIATSTALPSSAASPCNSSSSLIKPQPQETGAGGGGNGGLGGGGGDAGGGGGGGVYSGSRGVHSSTPQHVHNGSCWQHRTFVPAPPSTAHSTVSFAISPASTSHPLFDAAHPLHSQSMSRTPPLSSSHPLNGATISEQSSCRNCVAHRKHLLDGTSVMKPLLPFVTASPHPKSHQSWG